MRPPPPADSPWDRRATRTLLALTLLCAASTTWLVHPWYEATRQTADGSIYLLGAQSLLAGEGYSVLGMPFTVRPPGFSLMLAPLLAARGLDFHALNLFVSAFGVAAVAFLFALARPRIGDAAAFCLGLALWTNPRFQHLGNQVMSDVPGLALVLGCLVIGRWAERAPSARRDAVLGLAVGLSAYVRTAAVLLVPAEILARTLARAVARDRPQSFARFLRDRAFVLAAVPFALLLPWSLRNALRPPPWPADQTLLASYSTGMWHADGGDPSSPRVPIGEVLSRAPEQLPAILRHLGSRLDADAAGFLPAALGAVLVLALVLAAAARRSAPEIFALGLLGTLAFYFAVDWRLALPVFAIGLAATADAAILVFDGFLGRRLGPKSARRLVALLLLALALADFAPRRGWDEIRGAQERDVAFASALAARLRPEDTLAAPVGWHLSLRLDRPVHNLAHAARREGFAGVQRVIEEHGIDAVVVRTDPPEAPNLLAALEERYGRGESFGPGVVLRIR